MRRHPGSLIALIAFSVAAGACTYQARDVLPRAPAKIESSTLLSADSTLVHTFHAEENRKVIALALIPRHVRDAVVAIEDERYYRHPGVDLRGILRAARADAQAGRVAEGGSTITQQYVKQEILDNDDRTVERKLQEASIALQLEQRYSKERILELYLNAIYFGNGAYGIEAAARQYFGIPATGLSLAQGALLAGLIQRPGDSDPYDHPVEAKTRRDLVLERMRSNAFASPSAVDAALAEPVELASPVVPAAEQYPAAYFVEEVKQWILDDPRFGDSPKERRDLLFGGGLRIHTTVDLAVQAQAEQAANVILPDPDGPSVALVSIEPGTGFVRAIVGGRNFFGNGPDDKLNLATQKGRPAGSSFKPFILATALQAGIDPLTQIPAPGCINLQLEHEVWRVCNADGGSAGNATIFEGTVRSYNTLYAQLILRVGPTEAMAMATKLGVRNELETNPASVLGTNDVTPMDMASAYATFANRGVHVPPVLVTRITRADGTILYNHQHAQEKVLDTAVADEVSAILQQAVERGTGTRARLDRPAAGKTGTTDAYADAWFVGYTPELATAVWVGFPEGQIPMRPPRTPIRVFGGTYPAQIWQQFMSGALAGRPVVSFHDPPAPTSTVAPRAPSDLILGSIPSVVVPNVVGLSVSEATEILTNAGFTVALAPVEASGSAVGTVATQSPPARREAPPASTVTLEVAE